MFASENINKYFVYVKMVKYSVWFVGLYNVKLVCNKTHNFLLNNKEVMSFIDIVIR